MYQVYIKQTINQCTRMYIKQIMYNMYIMHIKQTMKYMYRMYIKQTMYIVLVGRSRNTLMIVKLSNCESEVKDCSSTAEAGSPYSATCTAASQRPYINSHFDWYVFVGSYKITSLLVPQEIKPGADGSVHMTNKHK